MGELSLTSTPSVTASGMTLDQLRKDLNSKVRAHTRGSWLVDHVSSNHFTLAGLRQYNVERGQQVIRIIRPYRDAIEGRVRRVGSNFLAVLPTHQALWDAFDRKHRQGAEAVSVAVRESMSPFVVQIGSVDTALGKFKLLFDHLEMDGHLDENFMLPGVDGTKMRRYITLLDQLSMVHRTAEGFKFTAKYENEAKRNRQRMARYGHELGKHSPVPFLSMILTRPDYLVKHMLIKSHLTYMDILDTMFRYQASATRSDPEEFPVRVHRVVRNVLRRFGRRMTIDQARTRLSDLNAKGALTRLSDELFSIAPAPFHSAAEIAGTAF